MERVLLKPREVADRLGVSVTTVYSLIKSGRLEGVVALGKGEASPRMMVEASVLATFLAQRQVAAS